MSALARLRDRLGFCETQRDTTAKTDNTPSRQGFVSFVSASPLGSPESEAPEAACATCGCGSFVRPPGSGRRCAGCEPVRLPPAHEQAGWAFAAVGPVHPPRAPLLMPPAPRPAVVYLDEFLAWTETGPIGRCRSCRFSGPLSERGMCSACEVDRLFAAAERVMNSPNALADPAELIVRGEPLP